MIETFNVFQFFVDGSQEKVVEFVPAERAVEVARDLINSVGGKLGTTQRVIITDGFDCINLEWLYGKGVVFPTPEQVE